MLYVLFHQLISFVHQFPRVAAALLYIRYNQFIFPYYLLYFMIRLMIRVIPLYHFHDDFIIPLVLQY